MWPCGLITLRMVAGGIMLRCRVWFLPASFAVADVGVLVPGCCLPLPTFSTALWHLASLFQALLVIINASGTNFLGVLQHSSSLEIDTLVFPSLRSRSI